MARYDPIEIQMIEDTVMINLQQEIAAVFVEGLRHCGIFSFDEIGNKAFIN